MRQVSCCLWGGVCKLRLGYISIVAVSLVLTACQQGNNVVTTSAEETRVVDAESAGEVINSREIRSDCAMNYDKVKELYNKGVDKSQNWCFSPYSLLDCMSLVATDVQGGTAEEFQSLGLDRYSDYASYDDNLPDGLSVSNRVYINESKSASIDTDYVRAGCDFSVLPFNEEAVKQINHNVAFDTNNKIDSIIDTLSPGAVSVFVNALYFNNAWDWTEDEVWWTPSNGYRTGFTGSLPVMDVKELSDKVDMARLVYPDTDFAMYLICANEETGTLDDLDAFMSDNFSFDMLSPDTEARFDEANFRMPSFEYSCMPQVQAALLDSGITESFGDTANFGRLGDLHIDSIVQKTYIKVNSEGTEAAAATGMVMCDNMAVMEDEVKIKNVVADNGFVYVIKDEKTGMILFMGRVVDPIIE